MGSAGMFLLLRAVVCNWEPCGEEFFLCSGCDRGQRYCSDECRDAARTRSKCLARVTYATSEKGIENNRERQRRFRANAAEKARRGEKNSNGSVFSPGTKCAELGSWSVSGGDAVGCASAPMAQREGDLSALDTASTRTDAGGDAVANAPMAQREGDLSALVTASTRTDAGGDAVANAPMAQREDQRVSALDCTASTRTDAEECGVCGGASAQIGTSTTDSQAPEGGAVSAICSVPITDVRYCHLCRRLGWVVRHSALRGRFRRTGHMRS